jgi:hypothetical protein
MCRLQMRRSVCSSNVSRSYIPARQVFTNDMAQDCRSASQFDNTLQQSTQDKTQLAQRSIQ